jgi:putative nucleotidyltransferase with HDIG domain
LDEEAANEEPKIKPDLTAYSGRWVALAGEQVAGVGDTAMAAERLGQRNRSRERLVVQFVEPESGQPLRLPYQLPQLQKIFRDQDQPVHLVGGAVRDLLLGREIRDLDFAVPHGAIRLAFKVANALNCPAYVLDHERDAGRVVLPDGVTTLDFASYRSDDLFGDLRSRDFTINAMALPAPAQTDASILDPCAGRADLEAAIVRFTHPLAIADDPVRALRAVRHAADFGFTIDHATKDAVRSAASALDVVSTERVRDELLKMIGSQAPQTALEGLFELDLLAATLPEVAALQDTPQTPPHYESALAHTFSVVTSLVQLEQAILSDDAPDDKTLAEAQRSVAPYRTHLREHLNYGYDGQTDGRQVLRLAALFHDVGKPLTLSVELEGRIRFLGHAEKGSRLSARRLTSLRLSREVVRHVSATIEGHMRPLMLTHSPVLSRRSIFRFFQGTSGAGLDITILALADQLALARNGKSESQWRKLLKVVAQLQQHYFEHYKETVQPSPILDGRQIMQIVQMEPGPRIGYLLNKLLEAQAAGEVTGEEEAIALVMKLSAEEYE